MGPVSLSPADAERLTRQGLRLARFTVAYNLIEGAVAITAGLLAGLVSLVGFGVDSGIESAASVLVGLRLAARLRHGQADEAKERRALKLVALTFFVLAAYVTIEGVRALLGGEAPDNSAVGLVLLVASIIVMPALARAKRRVAERLGGDPLILADAAETKICVLLSISTLLGRPRLQPLAQFRGTATSRWAIPGSRRLGLLVRSRSGGSRWRRRRRVGAALPAGRRRRSASLGSRRSRQR